MRRPNWCELANLRFNPLFKAPRGDVRVVLCVQPYPTRGLALRIRHLLTTQWASVVSTEYDKHLKLTWEKDGATQTVVVPISPSDWRAPIQARAWLRRALERRLLPAKPDTKGGACSVMAQNSSAAPIKTISPEKREGVTEAHETPRVRLAPHPPRSPRAASGFAGEKAESRWRELRGKEPPPKTVKEALERQRELADPVQLTVAEDAKGFERIIKMDFEGGKPEEVADLMDDREFLQGFKF